MRQVLTPRDKDLFPKFGPELTLRQKHIGRFGRGVQGEVIHQLFTPGDNLLYAGWPGVNIHSALAQEADQRLATGFGEVDREARGRGDGGDDQDSRREGFLHDLEGGAATHQEHVVVEWKLFVEQTETDDFVDGVVAANVFSQDDQFALSREHGGGVEPTGFREGFLLRLELGRHRPEGRAVYDEALFHGCKMLVHRVDAGLAAQPATRGHEDMAGKAVEIHLRAVGEKDVDNVGLVVPYVRLDLREVLAFSDDAFGDEEAGRQFVVVPRRTHRHADGLRVDANFEWFFDREFVLASLGRAG